VWKYGKVEEISRFIGLSAPRLLQLNDKAQIPEVHDKSPALNEKARSGKIGVYPCDNEPSTPKTSVGAIHI
jgi:hypothetical protein